MIDTSWSQGPPRTILLATDLTSRCDRAMQRSLQLAKLWKSRLVILVVIEPDYTSSPPELSNLPSWRRPTDPRRIAEVQIRRQFGGSVNDAEIRVVEGKPGSAIEEAAREVGADLIVTGVARDETFGRYLLGSTVDWLARQTSVPLLVVKSRVWPYEEILVATDFSETSRQALIAADRFFPTAPLTALHAFGAPTAGFRDNAGSRDLWKVQEKQACEDFIQTANLSFEGRARVRVLVEYGSPEVLVRQYMLDKEVELVVVGAQGATGLLDRRLGGTAKRILEFAPSDVLLIREPRAVRGAEQTR